MNAPLRHATRWFREARSGYPHDHRNHPQGSVRWPTLPAATQWRRREARRLEKCGRQRMPQRIETAAIAVSESG
jgi:hypothetical protein